MPNVYLYAANNPSEATLAKRRANAVTDHAPDAAACQLPVSTRALADLKDSLTRWRALATDDPTRADLESSDLRDQADAVDLDGRDPATRCG